METSYLSYPARVQRKSVLQLAIQAYIICCISDSAVSRVFFFSCMYSVITQLMYSNHTFVECNLPNLSGTVWPRRFLQLRKERKLVMNCLE